MILAIIYSHQPKLTIMVEPVLCHVYHVNRWSTCPVLDCYFDSVILRTVVLPREGVNGFTRASREYELFYMAETTQRGVVLYFGRLSTVLEFSVVYRVKILPFTILSYVGE